MRRSFALGVIVLAYASPAGAGTPADGIAFFEKQIKPVLETACGECHSKSAKKLKGGLMLDSKADWERGGDSGHASITPGRPDRSPLLAAVEWNDKDTRMPPRKKLPDEAIAAIRQWIEMGAPDPRGESTAAARSEMDVEEGRKFWAFQPPRKTVPPASADSWPRTDIDRHLLAAMKENGLRPAPDADWSTLMRRVAFDLTGLPPAPQESAGFADGSSKTYERLVDHYLASPRFGEKWGRHWLDVARYAESSGKTINLLYAEAWRYRDYVIAAFNADKPYNQFIREQIAGDLLPFKNARDQAEKIAATGFLAIGTKAHDERDRAKFLSDVADEQIDTVTQSMLGLSVACARCHDHKHDPIAQRDYYALAGIFLSTETLYGTCYQLQNWNGSSLVEMPPEAGLPSARAPISREAVAALDRSVAEARREEIAASFKRQTDRFTARFTREKVSYAKAERDLYDPDGRPKTLLMAGLDRGSPTNARLLVRGEITQPAETVPRGFPRVLSGVAPPVFRNGSGRLELADFIASKDNPLTARVMVNRVWSKLFGRGLVATPDDFGRMGARPSHPELLDHLALRFVESGWSVKQLIREIMLSHAYQQSTAFDPKNDGIDPDNQYLWRMSRRRLDAEQILDAMLAVGGRLDLHPPAGSPVALVRESNKAPADLIELMAGRHQVHRSIYQPVVRGMVPPGLACFDFADSGMVCGQRNSTNVPSQGLYLLNDEFTQSLADAFAARISKRGGSVLDQAVFAFKLALARQPMADERAAISDFITSFAALAPGGDRHAVLSAYCQSLFACGEFRYLN